MLEAVVQRSSSKHTATFIFLHGLGDSGHGWSSMGSMFAKKLPHVKFIFPHAPPMRVTWNGGYVMPSWYDIKGSLDSIDEIREDVSDFEKSSKSIMEFVQKEETEHGILPNRIFIGGFSQGGALSLYTALKSNRPFAGCAVLSSYLPLYREAHSWIQKQNLQTPFFMAHGTDDNVVPFEIGRKSLDQLKRLGVEHIDFNVYQGMAHSACDEELQNLLQFLTKTLP